jgi:hypothetical protein
LRIKDECKLEVIDLNFNAARRAKAETKISITLLMLVIISMQNPAGAKQGIYFTMKKYVPMPVPVFESTRTNFQAPASVRTRIMSDATGRHGN